MNQYRGQHLWTTLNNGRKGFLDRCERYAQVTIPKVCLPDHIKQDSDSIKYDWSSFGAQAVNHLTNRLMMGLFQPNFPFFRLDIEPKMKAQLLALVGEGAKAQEALTEAMSQGEQSALRVFDRLALRPTLYEALRALIVVGNVAMDYREDLPSVRHLKDYVVRRAMSGRLIKIVFYDQVLHDELEDAAKTVVKKNPEDKVVLIQEFIRTGDKWKLTQYADNIELPESFSQEWDDADFPISILTWDRAAKHDYGTGLIEDYSADFGNLSVLTESEIKLAIQLSDYRWLAHPTGLGDINDFKNSRTGDVIPGSRDDLSMVTSSQTGQSLQAVAASASQVITRLGRAFLMGSAVTRNAERVTAEEIRMVAQELETSFGGVYSRLAVDLQRPLVEWLMEQVDMSIKGTAVEPTIVTGLDALGRGAEAAMLMWFIQDLAQVVALGPVAEKLNIDAVAATLAAARGISPTQYIKSEAVMQQQQAAALDAQTDAVATQELAKAGAKAAVQ